MTSEVLMEVVAKIIEACNKLKIDLVISGGIAASVMGRPRATYDVDGVIMAEEKSIKELLERLGKQGFKYDKKETFKTIKGLPFISLVYSKHNTYVDLFVARSDFQKELLKRKKMVKLETIEIPLISAEDLILMKLFAGRDRDLEDVREVLIENKKKIDLKYLKKWAEQLGVGVFLRDEMESLG